MTIGFRSAGTAPTGTGTGTGSTSVTPALPASLTNTDMVLIVVGNKPDTATPSTPSGWALVGTVAGGTGSQAADTGSTRITVFSRIKDANWSTMPAITITSGGGAWAQAFAYTTTVGAWDISATGGADTSAGTAVSITGAATIDIRANDWLVGAMANTSDSPSFASEAFGATGLTAFGTVNERSEPDTSTGNDVGGFVADVSVNTGTATSAPTMTAVASGTNSANTSGAGIVVRLREPTIITGTDTASITVSDSSSLSAEDVSSVEYRSTSSNGNTALVSSITPTYPTTSGGILANDIVVVRLARWDSVVNPSVTAPSGWTHLTQGVIVGQKLDTYVKRMSGGESGNIGAFSWTGSMWTCVGASLYRNVDVDIDLTTLSLQQATTTGGVTTFASVAETGATDGCILDWAGANGNSGTHTPPTNWTEVADMDALSLNYRNIGSTGSVVASGATNSVSGDEMISSMLMLPAEPLGSTPITGTDTASVTVSDASAVTRIIDVTDTSGLRITDGYGSAPTTVREFNGTSDKINTDVGGASGMVYGTVAMLLKFNTVTGFRDFAMLHTSGGSYAWAPATMTNFSTLAMDNNGANSESGINPGTTNWKLVVIRKATGTTTPRFSVYDFGSSSWTHANGSSTLANAGTSPGSGGTIRFNFQDSDDWFGGRVAVRALWSNNLPWTADSTGDAAIVAAGLHTSLANWINTAPTVLQPFNQTSTGTNVTDISTTGTANQVSIAGTTVVSGDAPPGFDFGVGPAQIRKNVTYVDQYTLQAGTTGFTLTPPAGTAAGDMDIIWVANKNSTATPSAPSGGWTQLLSNVVGTGADGTDTGQIRITAWYRELSGTATSTSITVTGANVVMGGGMVYRKDSALSWTITGDTGSDTSSGTGFSATVGSNLLADVGDYLMSVGFFTMNTTLPGRGMTVPGTTNTVTGINSGGTNNGNHIFGWTDHAFMTAKNVQSSASSTTGTAGAATTGGALNILVRADFSSGSTPMAGTDSASIAISDSSAVQAGITGTDTASVTVTEGTTGLASSSDRTDTASVSIADASTNAVSSDRTDTASVAISDTSAIQAGITGTDTSSITITDVATVVVSVNVTDTASVAAADASTNNLSSDRTDTASVAIADASTNALSSSVTDTASVSIADTSSVAVTISVTDTSSVAISDSASVAIVTAVAGTDTASLTISDSSAVQAGLSRTDTASVAIADSSANALSSSVTDTSSVAVSDSSSVFVAISVSDTSALSITETSDVSVFMALAVADTSSIAVADAAVVTIAINVTDTSSISIGMSAVVDAPSMVVKGYHGGVWVQGNLVVWKDNQWKSAFPKRRSGGSWI